MAYDIKIVIDDGDIENLLTSAIEGGSNYWYEIQDWIEPKQWSYIGTHNNEGAEAFVKHTALYAMNEGGALMINDARADDPMLKEPVRLDRDAIVKGLKLFSSNKETMHHFADFINDNEDNITADVFLQLCVFGEVIYG